MTVQTDEGPLHVIGIYVPSRDATQTKTTRKRTFLEGLRTGVPEGTDGHRVMIGDFNILEPNHIPRYRSFHQFEYDFYGWLGGVGYRDAFRMMHPFAAEHSWVGQTGDGHRYDHAHVSADLGTAVRGCFYVHEPRTGETRLTDHSALSLTWPSGWWRRCQ
ncbi:hypothetical protein [Streptomyces sp. NBC_01589]|uniref:hypothetical protein n=1 Tax=unclassified Streptomyces TaxID=2593676 RepID=UPI00386CDCAE